MVGQIIKTACLLLSGIFWLSGCSSPAAESIAEPEPVQPIYEWGKVTGETLRVWSADEVQLPVANGIAMYEKLTGTTVEVTLFSKVELAEKSEQAFVLGTEERPDMLLDFANINLQMLNPKENFYDFIDAPWIDQLTDMALNQAFLEGQVIGFPCGTASVSGTLYNKDLFKKYNLEIPKTQAEFLKTCETLLQNRVIPLYIPYQDVTMMLYQFPMDSIFQDKKILDGVNNGTLTYSQIPEMQKIIEWYKTMADNGYLGADYTNNTVAGMPVALTNGSHAMVLAWDTWFQEKGIADTAKFGLMPAFMGVPENGTFEGGNLKVFMVDKKSPRIDAAIDLISFLADPINYNAAYVDVCTVPIYKNHTSSVTTPQYTQAERLIEKHFFNSTSYQRIKGFSQMDAKYIQAYMQGESTADECLRSMDTSRMERADIRESTTP